MQNMRLHQMPGPHTFDNATLEMEFDNLNLDKRVLGVRENGFDLHLDLLIISC